MKFSWPLVVFVSAGVALGVIISGIISSFTGHPELVRALGIAAGILAAFHVHNLWLRSKA